MTKAKQAKADFIKYVTTTEKYEMTLDRFGNLKYTSPFTGNVFRIKIQKNSWRLEGKNNYGWNKLAGAFFTAPNSLALIRSQLNNR